MTDLSLYIYEDENKFYFDPENYTGDFNNNLTLNYESGDMIKWTWEGQKMVGVIRKQNYDVNLFVIEKVTVLK